MGNRHIENVAQNLIGMLKITHTELVFGRESLSWAQRLYNRRVHAVKEQVAKMSPETLGKIVAQGLAVGDPRTEMSSQAGVSFLGRTPMYDVHRENYISPYDSGRDVLIELAATAIIAEMTDLLHKEADLAVGDDTSEDA